TALGAIRKAWEQGKRVHVYVDETRPLLQGARLTAWELGRLGIPYTLICDNMAGALPPARRVPGTLPGAPRAGPRRDVANKVGTYGLAVLCRFHNVPFYVVAPSTTFDRECASGAAIPIEEREGSEVRGVLGMPGSQVWNPAFDLTPRDLITKIVFEDRV